MLFRGELLRLTMIGILLASVPLVGAWAGSKWMLPWADQVGGADACRLQVDDAVVVGHRCDDRQLPRRTARGLDRPATLVLLDQPRRDAAHLGDVPADRAARAVVLADRVCAGSGGDAVLWLAAALFAGVVSGRGPRDRRGHLDEHRPVRHGGQHA